MELSFSLTFLAGSLWCQWCQDLMTFSSAWSHQFVPAQCRTDMLLNNVRYSPLVHLMTVWVCGAVMTVSVQTFDNPAGRTSIITVLILIEAIFSWNKMAASNQGLKTSMYFKVCISVCVYSSPVEWLCGCMQVHYECGVCHFPRCVCSNVCVYVCCWGCEWRVHIWHVD